MKWGGRTTGAGWLSYGEGWDGQGRGPGFAAPNRKQTGCNKLPPPLAPLLLDAHQQECKKLLRAIHEIPCVKSKADWALRWISHSSSFAERLVAFACVEGIHFSGR